MDNNQVTELLKKYRSYQYAVKNCGPVEGGVFLPKVYSERMVGDKNVWDRARYNRIVTLITGAVNEVLSDDQQTVIKRKYLDRNPMALYEIANALHKDKSTVSRWHAEALEQLAIALHPLSEEEMEIHNLDYMLIRQPA